MSQNKVSKNFQMYPSIQKKSLASGFYKIAISQEKVSSVVHFDFSFSKACFFGIIYQNFQKDLFKNEASKNVKK